MSNANDGNNEPAIIDFVDNLVIADPDSPSLTAFKFFTTRRARVLLQPHHFIFDAGDNGIG
jgi:RHS repeat-associated protein